MAISRLFTHVPSSHHKVYQREPVYSHDDWTRYRSLGWRFRPEPLLLLREALGYWQMLLLQVVISTAVVLYFELLVPRGAPSDFVGSLSEAFVIATLAVSVLMVFKLNTAYARWWEGRTQWGWMLDAMRSYLRLAASWSRPETRHVLEAACRWVPAALIILKEHLREEGNAHRACLSLLTRRDLDWLALWKHKPLAVSQVLSHLAVEAKLHPILQAQMEELVSKYVALFSGNERILRTPIPTAYTRFTVRACMLYVLAVPLLLWSTAGVLTPLVSLLVAFMILGVEHVAAQIEEPFRVLNLEALCTSLIASAKDIQPWDNAAMNAALDLAARPLLPTSVSEGHGSAAPLGPNPFDSLDGSVDGTCTIHIGAVDNSSSSDREGEGGGRPAAALQDFGQPVSSGSEPCMQAALGPASRRWSMMIPHHDAR